MRWETIPAADIEQVLEKSNGRLHLVRSFLALLQTPAFLKDTSGRVLFLNARAEQFWKVKNGAAIGKTIAQLFENPRLETPLKQIERRVTREQAAQIYSHIGTPPHFFTLLLPVMDSEGDRLLAGILVQTHS